MEAIKLTQKEILSSNSKDVTLCDFIKQYEKLMWQEGRVLCDILIDGQPFVASSEQANLSISEKPFSEIVINVETLNQLFTDTIESTKSHIKKTYDFTEGALEKYLDEEYHLALKDFISIIESAQFIFESIVLINEQLGQVKVSDKSAEKLNNLWLKNQTQFSSIISELESSFNTEDYVLQADILEYEFLSFLNESYKYLDEVQKAATSRI